jgi:tetratricopeptide (TPR) repeat protein
MHAGLLDEAEAVLRRSLQLNPGVRAVELMLARALLYQGRNAESEQVIRQMLAVSPDQPEALAALAVVLYYQGRLDEAATLATRVSAGGSQEKSPSCFAGFVYAARGERRKVDPQILRLRPEEVIIPELAYWLGSLHALLGNRPQALAWLGRTIELGNQNYPWFQRDKNFATLRTHPDYLRLLDQVRTQWEENRRQFAASDGGGEVAYTSSSETPAASGSRDGRP